MTEEYEVYQRNAFPPEVQLKVAPPGFTIFSCRAESAVDATSFLNIAYNNCQEQGKRLGQLIVTPLPEMDNYPDSQMQFTTDYDITQLREMMRMVEHSHVMIATLRPVPILENSMERDHSI